MPDENDKAPGTGARVIQSFVDRREAEKEGGTSRSALSRPSGTILTPIAMHPEYEPALQVPQNISLRNIRMGGDFDQRTFIPFVSHTDHPLIFKYTGTQFAKALINMVGMEYQGATYIGNNWKTPEEYRLRWDQVKARVEGKKPSELKKYFKEALDPLLEKLREIYWHPDRFLRGAQQDLIVRFEHAWKEEHSPSVPPLHEVAAQDFYKLNKGLIPPLFPEQERSR